MDASKRTDVFRAVQIQLDQDAVGARLPAAIDECVGSRALGGEPKLRRKHVGYDLANLRAPRDHRERSLRVAVSEDRLLARM
jgi:hypothetical protein